MLSSISWQQYFLFLGVATILYYLFVWVVYFKSKLPSFSIGGYNGLSMYEEDQPNEVLSTSQHVIDEIKPVFTGKQNKHELVFALQEQLRKYNQWDEPDFRETINAFIAAESKTICSIRLGEDDLRAVWKG
ncbi:MAG: hypothetical protein GC171_06080 [Terrimonas sp.]|nr:hypothetical protein [Terrimonas sp.]